MVRCQAHFEFVQAGGRGSHYQRRGSEAGLSSRIGEPAVRNMQCWHKAKLWFTTLVLSTVWGVLPEERAQKTPVPVEDTCVHNWIYSFVSSACDGHSVVFSSITYNELVLVVLAAVFV